MGFVRVTGYNQSDLDAAYQRGVADGEASGYDDGYEDGYDDGSAFVTGNPTIIVATDSIDPSIQMIINADTEDDLDISIYNTTDHSLGIIVNGSMSGANQVATIGATSMESLVGRTYEFPSGSTLHFKQDKIGGVENREGSIFLAIIGAYSNFTNGITWIDSEDRTEGSATFE